MPLIKCGEMGFGMKKEIIVIIIFIITYLIFTDLFTPLLYVVKFINPNLFYESNATIVSEHQEEILSINNSVNYIHYTDIEYYINKKKYCSSIYWNKNDVIGKKISIYILKKKNYIIRQAFSYSNQYLLSFIGLLIGIKVIISIFEIHSGSFHKYQKKCNDDNKNKLLKYYRISHKDMTYDLKIIKKYLKEIKAIKLYNDLSLIYRNIDIEELIHICFLFKKVDGEIEFIFQTKENWKDNRFKGYILLQKISQGYMVYKISDDFIYFYNEQTSKYEYLCKDLCSYLVQLKENYYMQNNIIVSNGEEAL